jgi:hypothetical protein
MLDPDPPIAPLTATSLSYSVDIGAEHKAAAGSSAAVDPTPTQPPIPADWSLSSAPVAIFAPVSWTESSFDTGRSTAASALGTGFQVPADLSISTLLGLDVVPPLPRW